MSYSQFLKECREFDKLAQECDQIKDRINEYITNYETAMDLLNLIEKWKQE